MVNREACSHNLITSLGTFSLDFSWRMVQISWCSWEVPLCPCLDHTQPSRRGACASQTFFWWSFINYMGFTHESPSCATLHTTFCTSLVAENAPVLEERGFISPCAVYVAEMTITTYLTFWSVDQSFSHSMTEQTTVPRAPRAVWSTSRERGMITSAQIHVQGLFSTIVHL